MKTRVLIFTDLDGTLLDYHTYSFKKALPALKYIRKKQIPLIICTSKTRGEIEVYKKKIRNRHPFISENGGAIFIPQKYFKKKPPRLKKNDGYLVKELGTPYQIITRNLLQVTSRYCQKIKGFGDMSSEEIHENYGLNLHEARLAKKREYDEPFNFLTPLHKNILRKMGREFSKRGLKISKGGRFFHLTGDNDKGKAMRLLKGMYEKEWEGKAISIGIGDSLNDLPLLLEVDFPVVVKSYTGKHDKKVLKKLKKPFLTKGIGPTGWNEAILQIVKGLE